jgi:hypothetical protein
VSKLEAGSVLRQPTQRTLEGLQPAEIVGEVANPVLEAARRFWSGPFQWPVKRSSDRTPT